MTSHETLVNKRILLGVTGGIAAYKSVELVRRLRDAGADVRVVMTRGAQEFVTPLTFQAVSTHPVGTELLDEEAELGMGHIEMAKWADLVLIAPATADFMARLTAGMGNDLLTTICLATAAPIAIAPAMNQQMWASEATQTNVTQLMARGIRFFGPGSGSQACGDVGAGRMLDVPDLVVACASSFETGVLTGKHVVITAGPTREAIDPVRYISNHSSGKMGYALAQAAIEAGANVTLISGPTSITPPERAELVKVESALDMHAAALSVIESTDVFIACAAVADYRVAEITTQKIKKSNDVMTLELVKNPDILADVAVHEYRPSLVVGFAAETQNVIDYARGKLNNKKLDAIVANDVSSPESGFNVDQNEATWLTSGQEEKLGQHSKAALARKLIDLIAKTGR